MNGVALPNGQIIKGMPHAYYFIPSGTPATANWIGPDFQVSQTTPLFTQDGSSGRYSCQVTPTELGLWTLVFYSSVPAVVHSVQFRCVNATDAQHALGLQPTVHAPVYSYPAQCIVNPAAFGTNATCGSGTLQRAWVSTGKSVIPWDGYVYGIYVWISNGSPANQLTSFKFFTVNPATSVVRGISENLVTLTPDEGSWTGGALKTLHFRKPVPCRAGDWYGFEADDTSIGGTTTVFFYQASNANAGTVQSLKVQNSLLSLSQTSGANTFGPYGTNNSMMNVQLIMQPPSIAVAGHSWWSGSPDTASTYTDYPTYPYVRADDIAAMIGELSGMPAVQCAWGGTDIRNWVGDATYAATFGLFVKIVVPLHPTVCFFDTVYNDANVGFGGSNTGFTTTDYRLYLDRLQSHAQQAGIELIFFEAMGSLYGVTHTTTDGQPYNPRIELLNALVADWCQENGIRYVTLRSPTSQYQGSEPNLWQRWSARYWLTNYPSYGLRDYGAPDDVHYSVYGRMGAAFEGVKCLRRGYVEPRLLRTPSNLADLTSPTSPTGQLLTIPAQSQAALTAQGLTTGRAGNLDKLATGVALSAAGLDGITAESGVNLRQAIALILDVLAGQVSGSAPAGGTVTISSPAGASGVSGMRHVW